MVNARADPWSPFGGRPVASDDEIFELLTASVFQARFRPAIVALRWPSIRRAFADFRLDVVASWKDEKLAGLLDSPGMIRSPKKVQATLRNARDLRERSRRFGSAKAYLDAFEGSEEGLVREIDTWAHYIGAPSIRWFVESLRGSSR